MHLDDQLKKLNRLARVELPGEYPGEVIYVAKRVYDGVLKKANLVSMRSIAGTVCSRAKVIIEYKSRRTGNRGFMELYDIGPKH